MNEIDTPSTEITTPAPEHLNGAAPLAAVTAKPKRKRKKAAKPRAPKLDPILAASKASAPATPDAQVAPGAQPLEESPAVSPDAAGPLAPDPQTAFIAAVHSKERGDRMRRALIDNNPRSAPPFKSSWHQRFLAYLGAIEASVIDHPDGPLDLRPASILTQGERWALRIIPVLVVAIAAWAAFRIW